MNQNYFNFFLSNKSNNKQKKKCRQLINSIGHNNISMESEAELEAQIRCTCGVRQGWL